MAEIPESTMTLDEAEAKLLPCPLCGGRAQFERIETGFARFEAVIVCGSCRLTLDWEQEFAFSSVAVIKKSLDPIEAWNRRYKSDEATTENL